MNTSAHAELPVLILHTGDPDDTLRRHHGDYAQMMRHAAGLATNEAHIVRACAGEQPADASAYRAALITGSPAMVTDREPWSELTAQWLKQAVAAGLPVFGVCYGHQLLAHALGGAVDYNPLGRELGTQTIECLPSADGDPLMAGLPLSFPAQTLHAQTVVRLPTGAVVLARSALDLHQLVRLAPQVYSAQFHPEFGPEFMRAHLLRNQGLYAREGLDAVVLADQLKPTPTAASLLRRFLRLRLDCAARTAPDRTATAPAAPQRPAGPPAQ